MKTGYIITILVIIITSSIIFGVTFTIPSDTSQTIPESTLGEEHYEIEITGMKDIYVIDEQFDFSYILSGYGYSCGGVEVSFPGQNGNIVGTYSSSSCIKGVPMEDFVLDVQKEYGTTYGHVKLQNPGTYVVTVTFDRPSESFPTITTKEFQVIEKKNE